MLSLNKHRFTRTSNGWATLSQELNPLKAIILLLLILLCRKQPQLCRESRLCLLLGHHCSPELSCRLSIGGNRLAYRISTTIKNIVSCYT